MRIDYHLHNHFSPDSETETRVLLETARQKGLQAICITNHTEWFKEGEGKPGSFTPLKDEKRFREVLKEIESLRADYPELMIGFGAELQYEKGNMDNLACLIKNLPFDFILGSVHNLEGINISGHTHAKDFFKNRTEKDAYSRYFEELMKLAEWGKMDAMAHFDIIKKFGHEFYGPFRPEKYRSEIQRILEAMKHNGIGIELNTGSLHKRCHELFPHPDILKWCVETDIEHFTLGSDAHEPEEIGRHLEEALQIAKEIGIQTLSTYKKRQPTRHKIKGE